MWQGKSLAMDGDSEITARGQLRAALLPEVRIGLLTNVAEYPKVVRTVLTGMAAASAANSISYFSLRKRANS